MKFSHQPKKIGTLYVKFASERSVHTLYRYSKYLQKHHRLVPYIPKQFYPRYRELESLAYNIRHGDYKYKTRVIMGTTDLILYKRKFNERYWNAVQPPHNLHASLTIDQPAQSPSHEQRRSTNEDSTSPTFARHQQAVYRADPSSVQSQNSENAVKLNLRPNSTSPLVSNSTSQE